MTTISFLPLLAHAFGPRMIQAQDEWENVDDVVRSSFLLLFGELQRQHKRINELESILAKYPIASPKQLTNDDIQSDNQIQTPQQVPPSDPSGDWKHKMLIYEHVHSQRYRQVKQQIRSLRSKIKELRHIQLESEEVFIQAAEKQSKRIQNLINKWNTNTTPHPSTTLVNHEVGASSDPMMDQDQPQFIHKSTSNTKVTNSVTDPTKERLGLQTSFHHTTLRRRYHQERKQKYQCLATLRQHVS